MIVTLVIIGVIAVFFTIRGLQEGQREIDKREEEDGRG